MVYATASTAPADRQSPETANTHQRLGHSLEALNKYTAARAHIERALAIHMATLGPDHPDTALSHQRLSSVLEGQGNLIKARTHIERDLAINLATLGPDPATARSRGILGHILRKLGKRGPAMSQLAQALPVAETTWGSAHPETLIIREELSALRAKGIKPSRKRRRH